MASEDEINGSAKLRHQIHIQLMGYLYPGTLLFPFLFEPFGTTVLPYYISKWLIRSRPDVFQRAQAAEDCLACPRFDLSRYGDILINVMLCVLMLALGSVDVWKTFAFLFLSLLWIYGWDQYRYLRQTTRSFFAADYQDRTAHYLVAFACAMLAGCLALRMHGAGYIRWHSKWQVVFGAVIVHLALHVLVLRFAISAILGTVEKLYRHSRKQDMTYSEAAVHIACSWFTANPVHCLRSRYIYQHKPPCVYCVKGKEHLIESNPEIGVFFNPPPKPSELQGPPTMWTRLT
jgi:predicted membrane protein